MDVGAIISIIVFVSLLICGIAAMRVVFKAARDAGSSVKTLDIPNSELVFATLSYSDEEWADVYQREFVADTTGVGMLDHHSGVIKTDSHKHDLAAPTIFFLPDKIYISDGNSGTLFKLSDVNDFGFGVWLYSVERAEVKTRIGWRVRGEVISRAPGAGPVNFPIDYTILLPAADDATLESIHARYEALIKAQGTPKR